METTKQESLANPANERKVTLETRVPMSVPRQLLDVPHLPGYKCHWMRATPGRIGQAQKSGYTYVTEEDLAEIGAEAFGRDLAGDGKTGSTDLGSRITVSAGTETDEQGRAAKLVLMKLPQEFADADEKLKEEAADRTVAALRSNSGVGQEEAAKRGLELKQRYGGETNRNIFMKRKGP